MKEKKEIKNIFQKNTCETCGKKYIPYQVIQEGKIVNLGFHPNCNCEVIIKFEKWQIPLISGAINLACIAEWWCARLREASEEGIDIYDDDFDLNWFAAGGNDSTRLLKHLDQLITQIKKQTGINLEYMESADRDEIRNTIYELVEKEKIRRLKKYHRVIQDEVNRSWLWKNKLPGDPKDYEFWAEFYAMRSEE